MRKPGIPHSQDPHTNSWGLLQTQWGQGVLCPFSKKVVIIGRSWRDGLKASLAVFSILWKLQQNKIYEAKSHTASLELHYTNWNKTPQAQAYSFEADLESLKAMEIETEQHDNEEASQNVRKGKRECV